MTLIVKNHTVPTCSSGRRESRGSAGQRLKGTGAGRRTEGRAAPLRKCRWAGSRAGAGAGLPAALPSHAPRPLLPLLPAAAPPRLPVQPVGAGGQAGRGQVSVDLRAVGAAQVQAQPRAQPHQHVHGGQLPGAHRLRLDDPAGGGRRTGRSGLKPHGHTAGCSSGAAPPGLPGKLVEERGGEGLSGACSGRVRCNSQRSTHSSHHACMRSAACPPCGVQRKRHASGCCSARGTRVYLA